ncbi:MAG: hypothetical protein GY894_11025 [Planctomycetes bacterium]|nr:hypothetical protein [Planctomycetota bacterium]
MIASITSVLAWGLCLVIGGPMALIGSFHLVFPRSAWSIYRGWGKLWGADPQKIAPDYKPGFAMRSVGVALFLGGVSICLIPKLLGY